MAIARVNFKRMAGVYPEGTGKRRVAED